MSAVPLTQAVTSGDASAVNAVLASGANVNERTGGGQTPLILATIFGHAHLIPLLLEAGADPHLRDNLGLNAIDWAQRRGVTEIIDVLTKKSTQATPSRVEIPPQTPPAREIPSVDPDVDKSKQISREEKSQRWIAGLKQRIAEQSQRELPDGPPNIFRAHSEPPIQPAPPREPEPAPEPKPKAATDYTDFSETTDHAEHTDHTEHTEDRKGDFKAANEPQALSEVRRDLQ